MSFSCSSIKGKFVVSEQQMYIRKSLEIIFYIDEPTYELLNVSVVVYKIEVLSAKQWKQHKQRYVSTSLQCTMSALFKLHKMYEKFLKKTQNICKELLAIK